MEGAIFLHRSLIDSYAFSNETTLKIWIWLLLRANWKKGYIDIDLGKGKKTIEINRGQLLFGRLKAAEILGIPASTIERHLEKLKEKNQIGIKKTTHFSIISIKKYNDYQQDTNGSEPPMNHQRTTNEPPTGTYNNNNNNNKELEPKGSSAETAGAQAKNILIQQYKELQKGKDAIFNFIKTNSPDFIEPYVDYWNLFAEAMKLPKVVSISKSRKRKFYLRLNDPSFSFTQILRKASQSNFILSGNWFGFDWIIENENNFLKVLEGKYDNGKEITETPKAVEAHKNEYQKLIYKQQQKID
jgi:hypothetical protein